MINYKRVAKMDRKIFRYCDLHNLEIVSYENGNHVTYLLSDGTRIRYVPSIFSKKCTFDFAENVDVKITNYCDGGCKYCHENSSLRGKHAKLYDNKGELIPIFKTWHAGTEMAIGGGNPLEHPDFTKFVKDMTRKGVICNVTINQKHLPRCSESLKALIHDGAIKGVGISLNYYPTPEEEKVIDELKEMTKNIIFHVIAGIYNEALANYCENNKVLILGYKSGTGRGSHFYEVHMQEIADGMNWLIKHLQRVKNWKKNFGVDFYETMSFDNTAIKQLSVKVILGISDKEWRKRFQGNDYGAPEGKDAPSTFYFDAVKREIARSSTQSKWQRIPYGKETFEEAFKISLSNYNIEE